MQIKPSSKDPTHYANGREKQEFQQKVKKGRSLVTENPAPQERAPWGGKTLWPRPHRNPNPRPPPPTQTAVKRNEAPRGQRGQHFAPAG